MPIRFSPALGGALALAIVALAPRVGAQAVLLRSDPFASSGGQSFKNLVRSDDGTLYCVSIQETPEGDRELRAQISEDGGASWDTEDFVFNDAETGLTGEERTNGCAVAIDDRGVLHVTWGNYYYPSSYRQLYRNWDPATDEASAIFDISAWTGAARTARTAAMDIAVDEDGTVWLVAHGTRSWVERLAHSAQPYAEGLEFVDVGDISPSASAQTTRLAIDADGRVHCTFYRNTGAGQYEHRIYDPAGGWGESANLGNASPENDLWGSVAADALGNLHVVLAVDATDNSPLWSFWYRRWDELGGWSEPLVLFEVETVQREGIANNRIFALGCDERSGAVTLLYRDLGRGGALGLIEKALDDEEFGDFVELAPPSSGQHAYYTPSVRGRLYPSSDRSSHGLHLTWQHRPQNGVAPYEFWFAAPNGSSAAAFRRGDTDGNGDVNLSDAVFGLRALFQPGSPAPDCVDAADSNDDGLFNLSDGVFTLNALFSGGPAPPAPGSQECGVDPSLDDLGCDQPPSC